MLPGRRVVPAGGAGPGGANGAAGAGSARRSGAGGWQVTGRDGEGEGRGRRGDPAAPLAERF